MTASFTISIIKPRWFFGVPKWQEDEPQWGVNNDQLLKMSLLTQTYKARWLFGVPKWQEDEASCQNNCLLDPSLVGLLQILSAQWGQILSILSKIAFKLVLVSMELNHLATILMSMPGVWSGGARLARDQGDNRSDSSLRLLVTLAHQTTNNL